MKTFSSGLKLKISAIIKQKVNDISTAISPIQLLKSYCNLVVTYYVVNWTENHALNEGLDGNIETNFTLIDFG